MHRSTLGRTTCFFALFLWCSLSIFSQTITYELPDEFNVCGTATFSVTINNNSGAELPDATVEVNFTTNGGVNCGVAYIPSTVQNASEDDLSDLGAPVFSLGNMPAGEIVTFTLEAEAPCSVIDCIDGAESFVNEINLNFTGGTSSTTTAPPYVIERALLVITNINDAFMVGSQGDVLERRITIVNTRPGVLENFTFTDTHQGGMTITTPTIGTTILSTNTMHQIELTGADFTTIGDGDELFEFNETIVITEFLRITDCGVGIPSTVSDLTASWGCGGEICQDVSGIAIVDIQESTKEPNLIFEPVTNYAECFCGPEGYQQGMKITNVGTAHAENIVFDLQQLTSVVGGIEILSVQVDSAGVLLDVTPGTNFTFNLVTPCDGTFDDLAGDMKLTIPNLGVAQSVTITWYVYFCDVRCNGPVVDWQYRYSYFKPCPPAPYVAMPDYIYVADFGTPFTSDANLEGLTILESGSEFTVNFSISQDELTSLTDELVIEIPLQCGLIWDDDNQMILGGQAPISIEQFPDSIYNIIQATYQLPLTSTVATTSFDLSFQCDSLCFDADVCRDTVITSCLLIPCSPPPPPQIPINISATIIKCSQYPLYCNLQTCEFLSVIYECPIDSLCENEPPGYAIFDFEAKRKNLGLPDNDDDRQPDGPGFDDLSLVRTDRLIAGDTIRSVIASEVVMDSVGTRFNLGNVTMRFTTSEMQPSNSGALLTDGTGILEAGSTLRVVDASSGNVFECSNLDFEAVDNFFFRYEYDISVAELSPCLPAGFAFENGDSVIFIGQYRIMHNLFQEQDMTPLSGKLRLGPALSLFNQDSSFYEPIICGCETEVFEISGYEYRLLPGVFALPPCDSSSIDDNGGSLLQIRLAEDNFFPFEFRNMMFAEDWRLTIPDKVELLRAELEFLQYQGTMDIFEDEPLDLEMDGDEFVIDLTGFQAPPIDEGWRALFKYVFKMDCDVLDPLPMPISTHLDFLNSMPEDEDPLLFGTTTNPLQPLIPNLSCIAFTNNIISFNDQLKFDLFLENIPSNAAGQSSGPAPNTWLYVTSQTGLVTDFQLVDKNGNVVPSVNGVFQLGDFEVGVDTFQLCGTNNSCETESFVIHFGWNCEPFTSQVQTSCYSIEHPFTITSPPGEIDFLVESPTGCYDLCETIPPYSLQIFNGELGAVYELIAQAQMPPGQTIIPGSSQVEYPTGSGNFFPVDDPVFINSTLAEWDLSAFDSLENGLPGVNAMPANSITLFFETTTECGFIADGFTLFTIAAKLNCGIPSNSVAKPGDPVCINGATQPYSTNIDVETETDFTCGNEMVFEFSMTASQALPQGACVIATLPQGVSLVPNSCESACQANFNCTPTIDGNTYTWTLPEGIPSNQIICFEFNTIGWEDLPCGDGLVIFRTANETQALCAETGDSCSTKINTGSLLFPYEIERPEFALENFTISASQTAGDDEVGFSIDIINCGGQNEPPVTVDFFLDNDGDGVGDDLVHTENLVAIISNCNGETMTGSFSLPPGNLCNLVAYLNPDQCACSVDSAYVFSPIAYQTDQSITICSEQTITIGVDAQAGFTYQWDPSDCLLDPNVSVTNFSCPNDTPVPATYQFTLAETDGGNCEINNLIDITVQPVPGIAFAETPICAGQPANLAATAGVSYNWQGPGISDPTIQIQTVTPSQTSTYSVTVTDVFACMGSEEVIVEVADLPDVNAGDDLFVCPGNTPQLIATFNPDWQYLWSPAIVSGQPALSDPTVHNPEVTTAEDATFTLTVIDENGCTGTDGVFVSQSGALDLVVSPDITICAGNSATLTISGGDSYQWTPSGICNDPPLCSSITVMPTEATTYEVIASTFDGCLDTAFVTVTPTLDNIETFDTDTICEGQSVMIHDTLRTIAQDYVAVFPVGDCDSISTITLVVNPVPPVLIIDAVICEGDSIDFNGEILTTAGSYTDTLTAANGCDSVVILGLQVLETGVEIIGPHAVAPGDSIALQIQPSVFDSISWSGGGMGPECANIPGCGDVVNEDVIYTVTTIDENGCVAIDTHIVFAIIQCFPDKAEVPNVFTPNGDGVNDTFSIVSQDSEEVLQMRVWDRWGRKVYDGTDPWDGTIDGDPAAQDVYIYDILVGCPLGVEADDKMLRGDVTLLR